MRKIKIYTKIAISWLKLRFKKIFYKWKFKILQFVRLKKFKKEAPKRLRLKRRPGKNVDLFSYDPEMDVIYQVLIKNGKAFVNPDHPYVWAANYKNAERKLSKNRLKK